MISKKLNNLHPVLLEAYKITCIGYKIKFDGLPEPFIVCVNRDEIEQNKQYCSKPQKSRAKWLQSPHNYMPAYAFDIAFIGPDGKLDYSPHLFERFWILIKKIEPRVTWGGHFSGIDMPHFELKNWNKIKNKTVFTTK